MKETSSLGWVFGGVVLAVSAAVLGVACSSSGTTANTTIREDTYATDCTVDSDCLPVILGDVCAPCACPSSAIHQRNAASYQDEYRTKKSSCPASGVQCGPCASTHGSCFSHQCTIRVCSEASCGDAGAGDSGAVDAAHGG